MAFISIFLDKKYGDFKVVKHADMDEAFSHVNNKYNGVKFSTYNFTSKEGFGRIEEIESDKSFAVVYGDTDDNQIYYSDFINDVSELDWLHIIDRYSKMALDNFQIVELKPTDGSPVSETTHVIAKLIKL